MSQQPYYPQQIPGQVPQQGYPQQPVQPYAQPQQPVYAQPPVPQGYPQQGQFPQAPAMPPAQPLANGTLDDFYSQPSTGGGPSISWNNKPDGTTYVGVVARDVTSGDVQHDTDPKTKQPKFYRDGRPMFSMKIPLLVQTPEFPDGEANLWIRSSLRDELQRAMSEAGLSGSPLRGDVIQVTLVGRKPGQGTIPKNIYAVSYQRQGGQQASTGAPSPAPVQQPVQQAQPQGQYPQTTEAPSPVAVAPQVQPQVPQQPVQQVQPVQQYAPAPAPQQPVTPVAPVQQVQQPVGQPGQPQGVPQGMSDQQAALLAKLTNQAQGGQG